MTLRRFTDHIIIHCSATPPGMDIGVKEIDRWHRERGFLRIGYHFVIRRDGTVEKGRDIDEVGAHARPWNGNSVGICLVGGVAEGTKLPEANYTPAQWTALETLLRHVRAFYPRATIIGHRDVPGVSKACPSFDVRAWARTRGFQE